MTIHRIATPEDREDSRSKLALVTADKYWTARREAYLTRLEDGPGRPLNTEGAVAADCRRLGLVDWVRDAEGKLLYGDHRCELTAAGREILALWRELGPLPPRKAEGRY